MKYRGFEIICPICKSSKNVSIDAFRTSGLTSVNPHGMALPIIYCELCDYEWNPLMGENK